MLKIFRLTNDMLGHFDNFFHELLARHFSFLHQRELLLPLCRQFRRIEFRNTKTVKRDHERGGFRRRDQLSTLTINVFLVEQAFDDSGACCWCSQPFFFHCRAQLFVINRLTGSLHGGEQCRLGITRRRLGRVCLYFNGLGVDFFA